MALSDWRLNLFPVPLVSYICTLYCKYIHSTFVSPVLNHPVLGAALSLAVDGSDSHVGAVLQQRLCGSWAPLAFFSKKLSSAKSKYSAFDRELLAAYSSIRHFRFLLEARVFTLFTDHKPLTLQSDCPSVQSMVSSPSLSIVSIPFLKSSVFCDVSSGSSRPLVPSTLRHQLFLSLHRLLHPGVCVSWRLLSSKFVWPDLSKDVGLWTRSCLRCQSSKIQSHLKSPVPSIEVPGRRFSHVHLDLVGPLPASQGFSYLLTMIDRTLRWLEAVPLSSITSESCT